MDNLKSPAYPIINDEGGINPECIKEIYDALNDLTVRCDRARHILQNTTSASKGNWGMLDTASAKMVI